MKGLSNFAWAQLDQFRQQGALDAGDLITKCGRDELLKQNLCCYYNGKWRMTKAGRDTAARMQPENWQGRGSTN